ncbi:hypothetical protein ASC65_12925 [Brevundimonas sp. Root1279]|nr:hypothetical protein ASC65_12925 [Brevundimonas sp. Root1279]
MLLSHEDSLGLRLAAVTGQLGEEVVSLQTTQAFFQPSPWMHDSEGRPLVEGVEGHLLVGGGADGRDDLIVHWDRRSDTALRITVDEFLTRLEKSPDVYVSAMTPTSQDTIGSTLTRIQSRPFVAAVRDAARRLNRDH